MWFRSCVAQRGQSSPLTPVPSPLAFIPPPPSRLMPCALGGADQRSAVMNMFRIPLNAVVVAVLTQAGTLSTRAVFTLCSGFLCVAVVLQVALAQALAVPPPPVRFERSASPLLFGVLFVAAPLNSHPICCLLTFPHFLTSPIGAPLSRRQRHRRGRQEGPVT